MGDVIGNIMGNVEGVVKGRKIGNIIGYVGNKSYRQNLSRDIKPSFVKNSKKIFLKIIF